MEHNVIMPRLGEEMTRGKIVEWLKKEGDAVKEKDLLFVVETDKATLEVEADASGVLKKIIAKDTGKEIPVGETIAIIEKQS